MSAARSAPASLAPVLAGPILRRVSPARLTLWLATRAAVKLRLRLTPQQAAERRFEFDPGSAVCRQIAAGRQLHYVLVDLPLDPPLPTDCWIDYDIELLFADATKRGWQSAADWAPDLCYPGRNRPGFMLTAKVGAVLHGSCRKPHHDSGDALVAADRLLQRCLSERDQDDPERPAWPSVLMLSGDQIYADDVAGPMLRAIHQLIERLGLPSENMATLGLAELNDGDALYAHPDSYYRREHLLPRLKLNRALFYVLFGGVRKPIFTADTAHNHLITLAEVLAMYLLAWSPAAWSGLDIDTPAGLSPSERALFAAERDLIRDFVDGLSAVRRLLAHLPVAMIFDDHDVTDDWNLNRDWEETAYAHPFSRRIIGNALIGYLLNQAWGNRPEAFDEDLLDALESALQQPGSDRHDAGIDRLLRFEGWDFVWPTDPRLIVLDTRTRRWRSESAAQRPSGLLDWEAITDLQQVLRENNSVILVSAAPIFGVKLIEAIQKIFTWFGKPLLVDAENWMAHPGTAGAILNVFRHPKTPSRFVVLSGDVHYSFVYDVELRGHTRGPDIWQICSSGLRNTFPRRLLDTLDRLNRWLYSPRSPLNWFTRRRHLRIIPRKPEGGAPGRRLLNAAGIGLVELDAEGAPWRIRQLLADGRLVAFVRREEESRWD